LKSPLIQVLQSLAALWMRERGLSASRLGVLVVNDGGFFDRIASGKSCTISTFDRFIAYFRDPGNWTEECGIPDAARELLDVVPDHATPDSAGVAPASGDNGGDLVDRVVPACAGAGL
jgi:hypothetical protein